MSTFITDLLTNLIRQDAFERFIKKQLKMERKLGKTTKTRHRNAPTDRFKRRDLREHRQARQRMQRESRRRNRRA